MIVLIFSILTLDDHSHTIEEWSQLGTNSVGGRAPLAQQKKRKKVKKVYIKLKAQPTLPSPPSPSLTNTPSQHCPDQEPNPTQTKFKNPLSFNPTNQFRLKKKKRRKEKKEREKVKKERERETETEMREHGIGCQPHITPP